MLIEHFAGAFPLWLAPEQARVMVVSQKVEEFGRQVKLGCGRQVFAFPAIIGRKRSDRRSAMPSWP